MSAGAGGRDRGKSKESKNEKNGTTKPLGNGGSHHTGGSSRRRSRSGGSSSGGGLGDGKEKAVYLFVAVSVIFAYVMLFQQHRKLETKVKEVQNEQKQFTTLDECQSYIQNCIEREKTTASAEDDNNDDDFHGSSRDSAGGHESEIRVDVEVVAKAAAVASAKAEEEAKTRKRRKKQEKKERKEKRRLEKENRKRIRHETRARRQYEEAAQMAAVGSYGGIDYTGMDTSGAFTPRRDHHAENRSIPLHSTSGPTTTTASGTAETITPEPRETKWGTTSGGVTEGAYRRDEEVAVEDEGAEEYEEYEGDETSTRHHGKKYEYEYEYEHDEHGEYPLPLSSPPVPPPSIVPSSAATTTARLPLTTTPRVSSTPVLERLIQLPAGRGRGGNAPSHLQQPPSPLRIIPFAGRGTLPYKPSTSVVSSAGPAIYHHSHSPSGRMEIPSPFPSPPPLPTSSLMPSLTPWTPALVPITESPMPTLHTKPGPHPHPQHRHPHSLPKPAPAHVYGATSTSVVAATAAIGSNNISAAVAAQYYTPHHVGQASHYPKLERIGEHGDDVHADDEISVPMTIPATTASASSTARQKNAC